MTRKAPRRTAERILVHSLALFNRFGEPNVSTTMISAELRISPGNLYYHYPSKDELINTLFDQYQHALLELLAAAEDVHEAEDAWFFLHSLFELIWQYRFFYRDLNHLLSRNRHLETRFPDLLARKKAALRALLDALADAPAAAHDERARDAVAASMVVLLTYWLSYEYVLQPRSAMEPENAQDALLRGAWHVLGLLMPHLGEAARLQMLTLIDAYRPDAG
ncbi:MAG: TetR/AcrR family transcriptional regulator [Rubrivivax sp.]|nr:TetR/AcrR family transcriptional regulator [Rubrivivax sp.]MCZ2088901.1 TetR/AcrR family transcriptional regulator [Burkholderiales bacterium]TXI16444.1 MAG: TetR/AcrR family transcriptional regulator [Ottowia sp.]HOZ94907.1 TetR/AcrR family transcriptional regulator [Ottowia sp.]HQO54373.1 TetR/AcrR family transcriptional regulator [Ottowia sp.]